MVSAACRWIPGIGKYYYSYRDNSWYGHSQWGTLPLSVIGCVHTRNDLWYWLRRFFKYYNLGKPNDNPKVLSLYTCDFSLFCLEFHRSIACCNMYFMGLHVENIGERSRSSQGLPGLQTELYIIRESYEGTCTLRYNYMIFKWYILPPPLPPPYLPPPPTITTTTKIKMDNRFVLCTNSAICISRLVLGAFQSVTLICLLILQSILTCFKLLCIINIGRVLLGFKAFSTNGNGMIWQRLARNIQKMFLLYSGESYAMENSFEKNFLNKGGGYHYSGGFRFHNSITCHPRSCLMILHSMHISMYGRNISKNLFSHYYEYIFGCLNCLVLWLGAKMAYGD